jgi:hypothetical protein
MQGTLAVPGTDIQEPQVAEAAPGSALRRICQQSEAGRQHALLGEHEKPFAPLGQDGQTLDLVSSKSKRSGGENVLVVDEGAPDERVGLREAASQHDSLQ